MFIYGLGTKNTRVFIIACIFYFPTRRGGKCDGGAKQGGYQKYKLKNAQNSPLDIKQNYTQFAISTQVKNRGMTLKINFPSSRRRPGPLYYRRDRKDPDFRRDDDIVSLV